MRQEARWKRLRPVIYGKRGAASVRESPSPLLLPSLLTGGRPQRGKQKPGNGGNWGRVEEGTRGIRHPSELFWRVGDVQELALAAIPEAPSFLGPISERCICFCFFVSLFCFFFPTALSLANCPHMSVHSICVRKGHDGSRRRRHARSCSRCARRRLPVSLLCQLACSSADHRSPSFCCDARSRRYELLLATAAPIYWAEFVVRRHVSDGETAPIARPLLETGPEIFQGTLVI